MTVEEIEILVTAKLEDVMKEFEKLKPQIMKQLAEIQKQVQEAFSNVDMKKFKEQVQESIEFAKKKIQDLKKSNASNEIKIKVNNEDVKKVTDQTKKELDSVKKQITGLFDPNDISGIKITGIMAKQISGVSNEFKKLSGTKIDFNQIKKQIQEVKSEVNEIFDPNDTSGLIIKGLDEEIRKVDTYWDKIKGLNAEISSGKGFVGYDATEILNYGDNFLNSGKSVYDIKPNLKSNNTSVENVEPSQESLTLWDTLREKIKQITPAIEKIKSGISKIATPIMKITKKALQMINPFKKASNTISGMTSKLKVGLGQVLKYAGALIGLRSIYQTLKSCASSWLSSQNAQAQQLSANIDYMKYAMR